MWVGGWINIEIERERKKREKDLRSLNNVGQRSGHLNVALSLVCVRGREKEREKERKRERKIVCVLVCLYVCVFACCMFICLYVYMRRWVICV